MNFKTCMVIGALLTAVPTAYAQLKPPAPDNEVRLKEVSVSATRTEKELADVPAAVTVFTADDIDRGLVQRIDDLIRYEPGVSVRSDPSRFGPTGFNIRGLENNRVLIQVDGVRMQDFFSFSVGPFNTATRNLVDLDSLKSIEILRGPGSSLYGSDALGGVVTYVTKDPADYLRLSARPWFASFKSSYAQADRSWNNTLTLAGGSNALQAMVLYTRRDGHERKTMGNNGTAGVNRTVANPQDYGANNVLAKLVAKPNDRHQLRLTLDHFDNSVFTNVLSLNAVTPTTSVLSGTDDSSRTRLSVDHEYRDPKGGWLAATKWSVYYVESTARQHSDENRSLTTATCSGVAAGANNCYIPRDFVFDQRVAGLTAQLESLFTGGSVWHRLLYGLDASTTNASESRDFTRYNLTLGTVSKTLAGETAPSRDFPVSDTRKIGIYGQDEISFLAGRVTVTPALRYDQYKLKVSPDTLYLKSVPPGSVASDFSDSALSPKVGAVYKLTPRNSLFGQYAHGFRAPPFDDLNSNFINTVQSYALIPNPNLKSETSRGVEVGIRGDSPVMRYTVSVFYNRYQDFIDSQARFTCPGDPRCVAGAASTFQSINRASVRIFGAEAKGEYDFAKGWSALGSVGWARGDDLQASRPLNTISPLKAVTSVRYRAPADAYGAALTATLVEEKDRVDDSTGPYFHTPGFSIFDFTGYWNLNKQAVITAGIFNLLDRKYYLWSDLSRVSLASGSGPIPNGTGLDRYSQPGRNAAVSFKYQF